MDWNGLLVLNFLYKVIYTDHLLSFWNSGILLCARQSVSTWPVPKKPWGFFTTCWHWVSDKLPWLAGCHRYCPSSLLEYVLWESHGRGPWEFIPIASHMPFPWLILLLFFHQNKSFLWRWLCAESCQVLLVNHHTWGWLRGLPSEEHTHLGPLHLPDRHCQYEMSLYLWWYTLHLELYFFWN